MTQSHAEDNHHPDYDDDDNDDDGDVGGTEGTVRATVIGGCPHAVLAVLLITGAVARGPGTVGVAVAEVLVPDAVVRVTAVPVVGVAGVTVLLEHCDDNGEIAGWGRGGRGAQSEPKVHLMVAFLNVEPILITLNKRNVKCNSKSIFLNGFVPPGTFSTRPPID